MTNQMIYQNVDLTDDPRMVDYQDKLAAFKEARAVYSEIYDTPNADYDKIEAARRAFKQAETDMEKAEAVLPKNWLKD